MEAAKVDALDRGIEMLGTKIGELPPLAREFACHLCNQVGMCIEVLLTAYAVYAQCAEGLPCSDDLYVARPEQREWFRSKGFDC